MPHALAVDLGGTKVEAALVDHHGATLPGSRHRENTGPDADGGDIAASLDVVARAALAALPDKESLIGVGIGSAGPIDAANGRISPLNIPGCRDYPIVAQLSAIAPGVPVELETDGLAITLAEHWVGAGRGVDNMMGMVVSTGIGGGLILGGRPLPGPSGNGGHIGHLEVGGHDEPCACGGTGCVEAVASGPRTVAWARAKGWQGSTGEELAAAHRRGEAIAIAAVERSGSAIGHAIAAATALVDLELVAIGGGFSQVSPALFDVIRSTIAGRGDWQFIAKVRVVPSALGTDGPLIGAAALIHRRRD